MDNKLKVPVLKVFRTGLSFYLFFSTKMRNNDIIKSDIYMFLLYNHMCCFEGQAMRFYYVYSEFVTGFDIDASKNYKIVIFSDINVAIEKLLSYKAIDSNCECELEFSIVKSVITVSQADKENRYNQQEAIYKNEEIPYIKLVTLYLKNKGDYYYDQISIE